VKDKKTTKKPNIGKDASAARKPSIASNKGKRKAPQDDEETATVGSASEDKAVKSTKGNSERGKTKTKVPPAAADVDDETNDAAMPKKKKMRKLFASAKPNSLDWANQFNIVSGFDIEAPHIVTDGLPRVMAA
jgi:hypothetical protein